MSEELILYKQIPNNFYVVPLSLNYSNAVASDKMLSWNLGNLINIGMYNNELKNIKVIRMYGFDIDNIDTIIFSDTSIVPISLLVDIENLNTDCFFNNFVSFHFSFQMILFNTVQNCRHAFPFNKMYSEYVFSSYIQVLNFINLVFYIQTESKKLNINNGVFQFEFICFKN